VPISRQNPFVTCKAVVRYLCVSNAVAYVTCPNQTKMRYVCVFRLLYDILEYQNKHSSRMFQIQLICQMEVRLSLTSWVAVTIVSKHQRLLPKTISFAKFVSIAKMFNIGVN